MQTFSDLSLSKYNSPTNVVWLEQLLYKVFKSKAPPEKIPLFAKNLLFFLLYKSNCISWCKKFSICTSKTYFFYFTLPFLQNTHINLSIIHIYLNKIFIFKSIHTHLDTTINLVTKLWIQNRSFHFFSFLFFTFIYQQQWNSKSNFFHIFQEPQSRHWIKPFSLSSSSSNNFLLPLQFVHSANQTPQQLS